MPWSSAPSTFPTSSPHRPVKLPGPDPGGLRGGLLSDSPRSQTWAVGGLHPGPGPIPNPLLRARISSSRNVPTAGAPIHGLSGPQFPHVKSGVVSAPPLPALTCGGCCQGGSPPRCRSQIRQVRTPLQPHSRRTSGAATTAAAIAASRKPVRRRAAAGPSGSCSPPAAHEARRALPSGRGRRGASAAPPPGLCRPRAPARAPGSAGSAGRRWRRDSRRGLHSLAMGPLSVRLLMQRGRPKSDRLGKIRTLE